MRKLILSFGIPFAVVFGGAGIAALVSRSDLFAEPCAPMDVELDDLDPMHTCVRVRGMAHFEAQLHQHFPGNMLHEEKNRWIYPMFHAYDAKGRAIRLLIDAPVQPEARVSYEFMEVEGKLSRLTPEIVPYELEVQLGKTTDYFLTDDTLVISATAIHPWTPEPQQAGK